MTAKPTRDAKGKYSLYGSVMPECYAVGWNGAQSALGNSTCLNCPVFDHCLDAFAVEMLPKAEGSLGRDAPVDGVVHALSGWQVEAASVVEARKRRVELGGDEAGEQKDTEVKPVAAKVSKKTAPAKKVSKKAAPKVTAKKVTKKAPTKKAAAKKAPAKKVAKKVAAKKPEPVKTEPAKTVKQKTVQKKAGAENPRKAPRRASSAKAKAPTKAKQVKRPAKPVTERGEPGSHWRWGEHTQESRWARERERNPSIAQALPIGAKVTREFPPESKVKWVLETKEGHYLLKKQGETKAIKFPTLYKAAVAVTGQESKWSGFKFWRLRTLIQLNNRANP